MSLEQEQIYFSKSIKVVQVENKKGKGIAAKNN